MMAGSRILVVDDDAGGRRLTRATLKKAGFEVSEARDGEEALALLRAEMPDLVLMDVSMPVMDGFTAVAALRAMPGGARVPVVMMTGLDDVGSIDRAFEVGATDFITKPLNWTILAHRVRYILRASAAINDLKQNQRRLSNAQRIGEMGDWEWDVRQGRILPSEQALRIFGYDAEPLPLDLDRFLQHVHGDDQLRLREAFEHAIAAGAPFAIDHRIVADDGSSRHVRQQVEVNERDSLGRATHLAGAVHDITRRKEAEEQIRRLAYYDPLTELPNRRHFTEQLQDALLSATEKQQQLSVMFIDLDHFKRVNDTLGHGAGDELLRVVSARLAHSLRGSDTVARASKYSDASNSARGADTGSIARLGGDEFILLLKNVHSPDDAAHVARRLTAAMAEPVTIQGTEIFVGSSIGIAMYPADGADIDSLLMNADTAMYHAKEAGRGDYRFYTASMNARALDKLQMEAQLRRALDRGEFVLHYQPRVEVATGRIVGAEALIRWQHPELGLVPPGEFIPLAEDTGLVIPIGEWALAETCRQVAQWQASGLTAVPVAVNLASTHLRERGLPDLLAQLLGSHKVRPGLLEIEVTESILLSDPELSVQIAQRIGEMDVRLSIDDFGTGYSSLSYLKRLPIHALKIDRSFIRDLASDPDDAAIITAIIVMAHSLKLKVIAEGVETEAQLAFLKARQCDEYQGFLMRQALPAAEFAELLASAQLGRLEHLAA
jgi:PAS domain S-box-containing protein